MDYRAIIGTYSEHGSKGIYSCSVSFDDSVAMERTSVTQHNENPTFLARHPENPYLYVVHEVDEGGVTAYRVHSDGTLEKLNYQSSGASGPCYCSVHPSGEFLFVAHYHGAAVSMIPIREDGHLETPSEVIIHEGSGPNPERQTQSHPHSAVVGPNGRYLYVPDLGTDEVVIYSIETETRSLTRTGQAMTAAGAGPRHMDFHPTEPIAYLINELDSTISVFTWDAKTGSLDEIDVQATLPTTYTDDNQTSEIRVHPSGNWVYGANRGHDSIAVFGVQEDGSLSLIETGSTGGEWPRFFTLNPQGDVLFVQNRYSDDIIPFRIDQDTGTLTEIFTRLDIPAPSCMVFLD